MAQDAQGKVFVAFAQKGYRERVGYVHDADESVFVQLDGHKKPIEDIRFSHDGEKIYTASQDGSVREWNVSGECISKPQGYLAHIHDAPPIFCKEKGILPDSCYQENKTVFSVTPSPLGNFLATYDVSGNVTLWDTKGDKPLKTFQATSPHIVFSPDDKMMMLLTQQGLEGIDIAEWLTS